MFASGRGHAVREGGAQISPFLGLLVPPPHMPTPLHKVQMPNPASSGDCLFRRAKEDFFRCMINLEQRKTWHDSVS